jgi:hypothetical protein
MSRSRTAKTVRDCPVVTERSRTTAIAGGPSAGKTGLVIERVVDLLAPDRGAVVAADRLLVMTGSAASARDFEARLRGAIAAELASETLVSRRRALIRIAAGLDDAIIAGGAEIAPRLLARLGRCPGPRPDVELLDLLDRDAEARFTLTDQLDHVVVDEVDDRDDWRCRDRIDIASMLADTADITIAGEAALAVELGGECLAVSLGDRSPRVVGRGAAGATELVADLATRVRDENLSWFEVAIVAARRDVGALIAELDGAGIPVADHTGSLMEVPVMRQIAAAVAGLADDRDAVGAAALRSPPLFAIDAADRFAVAAGSARPQVRARLAQAESVIAELRHRRRDRPAGETVRALLRSSGCARALAIGPVGAIWLARLASFCEAVDELAATGLDFDAAAAEIRGWVGRPPTRLLDGPAPTGTDAVWLGPLGELRGAPHLIYTWHVNNREIDRARRRAGGAVICCPPRGLDPVPRRPAEVAREPIALLDGQALADAVGRAWERVEPSVRAPRLPPVTIAALARRRTGAPTASCRFDAAFEDTVKRALEMALLGGVSPASAVTAAALETGLESYLGEATADVENALERLDEIGIDAASCRFGYPITGVGPGGELVAGSVDIAAIIGGEMSQFRPGLRPGGSSLRSAPLAPPTPDRSSSRNTRLAPLCEMSLIDVVCAPPPAPGDEPPADLFDRVRIASTLIQRAQPFPAAARGAVLFTADGSLHELPSSRTQRMRPVTLPM